MAKSFSSSGVIIKHCHFSIYDKGTNSGETNSNCTLNVASSAQKLNRKLQQEKINQIQTFCSYPVPVNRKQKRYCRRIGPWESKCIWWYWSQKESRHVKLICRSYKVHSMLHAGILIFIGCLLALRLCSLPCWMACLYMLPGFTMKNTIYTC